MNVTTVTKRETGNYGKLFLVWPPGSRNFSGNNFHKKKRMVSRIFPEKVFRKNRTKKIRELFQRLKTDPKKEKRLSGVIPDDF